MGFEGYYGSFLLLLSNTLPKKSSIQRTGVTGLLFLYVLVLMLEVEHAVV